MGKRLKLLKKINWSISLFKNRYIKLLCYAKMAKDIEIQIKSFLEGFHELIPTSLISIFDSKELELMISGLPDIDRSFVH